MKLNCLYNFALVVIQLLGVNIWGRKNHTNIDNWKVLGSCGQGVAAKKLESWGGGVSIMQSNLSVDQKYTSGFCDFT